jgi:hypothetical protein
MISVPRIANPTVKPTRLIPVAICCNFTRLLFSAFASDPSAFLRLKAVRVDPAERADS